MADFDVSIVLTLHREARYLHRTVAALSEAATCARSHGVSVELVAVLDRADSVTERTLRAEDFSAFAGLQAIAVNNGSLGPSRNDGCEAASGKYLVMCDGDDLMGYSLIARAFATAERSPPHTFFVPEFIFGFGYRYFTTQYFTTRDTFVCATVKYPTYSACVFGQRSLFAENPYADIKLSPGYAFEDWHFNCNAVARGWHFAPVDGTAWFYRQRLDGLLHDAERISTGQIPPSRMFAPPTFLDLFAGEVERAAANRPRPAPRGAMVLADPIFRDLVRRANAIDPGVELDRYRDCMGHFNNLTDPTVGIAYYRACELVADAQFDAVFLQTGDEPPDFLERQMREFAATHSKARPVILRNAPEPGEVGTRPSLPGAMLIDLASLHHQVSAEDRDLLALKLLQTSAAAASLHCSTSAFAYRFLSRFGALFQDRHITCYRTSDRYHETNGYAFVDPLPFQLLSDHLDVIDRIVWFDEKTMEQDWVRLPEMRKQSVLRVPLPG